MILNTMTEYEGMSGRCKECVAPTLNSSFVRLDETAIAEYVCKVSRSDTVQLNNLRYFVGCDDIFLFRFVLKWCPCFLFWFDLIRSFLFSFLPLSSYVFFSTVLWHTKVFSPPLLSSPLRPSHPQPTLSHFPLLSTLCHSTTLHCISCTPLHSTQSPTHCLTSRFLTSSSFT